MRPAYLATHSLYAPAASLVCGSGLTSCQHPGPQVKRKKTWSRPPKPSVLRAVACAALLGGAIPGAAAKFELDTPQHVLDAARELAYDGMALYEGNRSGHTPGRLSEKDPMEDGPYWWWHGSVFLNAYVEYWGRTGDATYNRVVAEGMVAQAGENSDYQPRAQRSLMSNTHQCSWAAGALLAAESKMPTAGRPDWLRLAQNVFDVQAARFDAEEKPLGRNYNCGGGLRTDIDTAANGFYYKDTLANGCFMSLGARLAKHTGNETYAKYSERVWDWLWDVGYIDPKTYTVYHGAPMTHNCTAIVKIVSSGIAAWVTEGAAFMFNFTKGSPVWRERTAKLAAATLSAYFPDGVATEVSCEKDNFCSGDRATHKGVLLRSLTAVAGAAPFTAAEILPALQKSAAAAVAQCTGGGGGTGRRCGFSWTTGRYTDPRSPGLLEQANALAAVTALVLERPAGAATPPGPGGGDGGGGGDKNAGARLHPAVAAASVLLAAGVAAWAAL